MDDQTSEAYERYVKRLAFWSAWWLVVIFLGILVACAGNAFAGGQDNLLAVNHYRYIDELNQKGEEPQIQIYTLGETDEYVHAAPRPLEFQGNQRAAYSAHVVEGINVVYLRFSANYLSQLLQKMKQQKDAAARAFAYTVKLLDGNEYQFVFDFAETKALRASAREAGGHIVVLKVAHNPQIEESGSTLLLIAQGAEALAEELGLPAKHSQRVYDAEKARFFVISRSELTEIERKIAIDGGTFAIIRRPSYVDQPWLWEIILNILVELTPLNVGGAKCLIYYSLTVVSLRLVLKFLSWVFMIPPENPA